ncbi:MAG: transcription termination/antitermination NusG family protein, partial [Thaumarchaeota archaeon]|nr:transcription termination/antitermination NusG family protein [Nitrososphaerota archaeon]
MFTNLNISKLTPAEYFENKTWMIIHAKSRREKKIARYCTNMNIKYYLPLEKRIKIYGRKKVQTTLPLFPGYLFCIADEKERHQLLLTHQIANI